jgi:hypothetical protein
MRLSAEMYNQIVEGLRSDSHRDKDKRREPRVGMAGEAQFVTMTAEGKRIAGMVKVRDVSRSGLGLLFAQQIPAQQRFVVQLASSSGEPIWVVCNSTHCRRIEGDVFSVGARILQLLRSDEIHKVEAKAAKAHAASLAPPPKPAQGNKADIARVSRAVLG